MALLGRWTGGTIASMQPSTSWAAPNGLFPTETRNDSSTYGFASSTSTITLPSTNLADGYLVRASLEFEDSSNGRCNIQGKFEHVSGTGDVVRAHVSGYNRDSSEDRSFIQTVGVIDSPSASQTIQFQWKRDSDSPGGTDGTVYSCIEVIPLYYSNIGMYYSTTTAALNGTTPNTVSLGTTIVESDTNAIERSGNTVTLKGDNKRYLIIGNVYAEGFSGGSNRTQRVIGLGYDSTLDDATRGYLYARQSSCDNNGAITWDICETATADKTVELLAWQGDSVTNDGGGAENGGSTPGLSDNALIIIELNDSAEVFRSHDSVGLQSDSTTPTDLNVVRDVDFNDSASWTKTSDTAFNAETDMDAFIGGNIFTARETIANTSRRTTRGHITVNGTEDAATAHGNYSRGDQSTTGTFAGGFQPGGFVALSSGDDVGLSQTAITGTEGGNPRTQAGTVGLWGINLDTLQGSSDGISSVNPTTFAMNASDVDINGSNFEASQGTGSVYLSDATTLAGSANEVDISSAVNTWADGLVNLDLSTLSESELDELHTLGPGTRYIILVNNSSDEYNSSALTITRPASIEMVLGAGTNGSSTSRLSGLTGTFDGGQFTETVNPSASNTTMSDDGHREDTWSIQLTDAAWSTADFEFRVLYGGEVPATITVTPEVSVGVADVPLNITAGTETLTLSPTNAGLTLDVDLDVTAGNDSLAISTTNASLTLDVDADVSVGTETLTLSPTDASLVLDVDADVTVGTETLTISTTNATLVLDVDLDIVATTETLTISPTDASVTLDVDLDVTAGTETLTLSPTNATISSNVDLSITATTETLTLSPTDAALVLDVDADINVGTETLTLSPTNAIVDLNNRLDVTANSVVLSLITTNATIELTSGIIAEPTGFVINVNGGTPTYIINTEYNVEPGELRINVEYGWSIPDRPQVVIVRSLKFGGNTEYSKKQIPVHFRR